MANKEDSNKATIYNENLDVALGQRYLAYALSTITDRALPDSRDGLKPVHRRILYAMRQLKLVPTGSFRKCAKIVGEVMGNYHPHGDKAIYDSLVRMAQTFTTRYPLIEGQGNFGNIDGDNAAAQRYTEARLSEISMIMLEGLDESAVDFKDNYDGSEKEPEFLPAFFPQLLANGAYGIAVGMATNIPPHNIREILDASIKLIQNSKLDPYCTVHLAIRIFYDRNNFILLRCTLYRTHFISGTGFQTMAQPPTSSYINLTNGSDRNTDPLCGNSVYDGECRDPPSLFGGSTQPYCICIGATHHPEPN